MENVPPRTAVSSVGLPFAAHGPANVPPGTAVSSVGLPFALHAPGAG
jgi:hypothetical protein